MKYNDQLQEKKSDGEYNDYPQWEKAAKREKADIIDGDIGDLDNKQEVTMYKIAMSGDEELGSWIQYQQDLDDPKVGQSVTIPGYGEFAAQAGVGDRGETDEREFTVPSDIEVSGEQTMDVLQYKGKPDFLSIILADIADRAVDDEVMIFASNISQKIASIGDTFGQDPKDPAYQADKKKAVALARIHLKHNVTKLPKEENESVEEDEVPFEETTKTDPFDAYAESMDRIAEYDEYAALDSFTNNLNLSPEEDAKIAAGPDAYEADDELMAKLMDHFSEAMPYGTQKGRDGDPYEFIFQELDNMGLIKEDNVDEGSFNKDGSYNTSDDEANEFDDEDDDSEDDKDAKPDFLDIDGDGDKKEPMKKAVKDKKKVEEAEGETIHAWWETQKGPGDMGGWVLRYFKKNEDYDPNAEGLRNGPYFTPSLDWWMSVEDFEQGKQGFNNKTDADAEGWEIHDLKSDALAAIKGTDEGTVKEGTWHIADDMSGLQELIASGPIPAKDAIDTIRDYIGEDDLYDAIGDLEDMDPNADARDIIRDFLEQGDIGYDTFEEIQTVEEDDLAWLKKAAGIGSGARSNHGIHEGEEGYQITPRSLVAREMRKLQDLAKN
jgi:hypothetical protein